MTDNKQPLKDIVQSKYTSVLFDLDGTLLDTANDLGEALNYVLQKHGLPTVERKHYRPVASDGAKGLLELGFGDKLPQFNYEELRQEFLTYYENNISIHTQLYPNVPELLSALNEKNIPWGIVTNKPEYLSKILVPKFSELDQCKSLVAGDTLAERKPHPAPLLFACKEMNITPENCVYVGDAPRDIEAGNNAGMFSIVAKWGYITNLEDCKSWGGDFMTLDPLDILLTIK